MNTTQQRMAAVFDEWAKRYAESPDEFSEILDEDGKPVTGYGERCARYFEQIAREMDEAGVLPRQGRAEHATKPEWRGLTDELDDEHPQWLVNEQIKGLLEGEGATEDHEDVLTFLRATELPEGTVRRMHWAIATAARPA